MYFVNDYNSDVYIKLRLFIDYCLNAYENFEKYAYENLIGRVHCFSYLLMRIHADIRNAIGNN